MNWRPASPFDSVLADELVRFAFKRDRRAAAAAVMIHGHGLTAVDYGELLGRSRTTASNLCEKGTGLMRQAMDEAHNDPDDHVVHPDCCCFRCFVKACSDGVLSA